MDQFYEQQLELYEDGGMPELKVLQPIIDKAPGSLAIDVGANIGELTYYFIEHCDVARVEAFEPSSKAYPFLAKLSSKNVTPHKIALSDKSGSGTLITPYTSSNLSHTLNTGVSSLHKEWIQMMHNTYPEAVSEEHVDEVVELRTVDSYNFNDVKVIKVDVEGHEEQVIRGATETIKKYKPILIVEVFKNLHLFDSITSMGYKCLYYNVSLNILCEAHSKKDLPEQVINLVFVPK